MSEKGILVVVSGFSGAGKGTIMKRLMETRGENYALSVSATTRKPRPGEVHGREYFFVDTDEFERMIEQDELHRLDPLFLLADRNLENTRFYYEKNYHKSYLPLCLDVFFRCGISSRGWQHRQE